MPNKKVPSTLPIRIALVGAGRVSDYHHAPAIRMDARPLVAACDADPALLEQRRTEWGLKKITTDFRELCADPEIDALVIATPNFTHCEMATVAAQAGKHLMCEKPLGLNADEVRRMVQAADKAGVVHMTAFTYRFVPSMRYLKHLVASGALGEPRHFRSQRFVDWPETGWGWRQYRAQAGAGDLFDMTIHRIDLANDLMGPIEQICGAVARFAPRTETIDGRPCPPSDVDDWSALLGEFVSGATGVWEGTTLAKGFSRGGVGHECAEVNGSEGSGVYQLHQPNTILLGKTGRDLAPVDVPQEFLKPADSPRDLSQGNPEVVFRYDLMWEFVSAIVERREARPSFVDGLNAQIVADAVLRSHAERRWVGVRGEG